MGKKIKITEAQFKSLAKFLMETPFDKMTKDNVKDGDVIRITIGNLVKKYKVISSFGGQIQMDGMDSDNSNYRYFISSNSFDKNEIDGRKVDKDENPELAAKNPNQWERFFTKISNFEVLRDGEVVDAVDINGQSSFTPPEPEPKEEPIKPLEKPEEPSDDEDDDLQQLGLTAMKAIINDPQMKDAFYRQPSFWRLFMADLKGETAKGKGILPTLDIVGKYMDRRTNMAVGSSAFKNNKIAKFIILDDVNLEYMDENGNTQNYPIGANTKSEATNTRENLWDENMQKYKDYKILSNKKTENGVGIPFKLAVKKKIDKGEDTFLTRFIGIINGRETYVDNVRVKFLQSNGYDKTLNKTNQIK